MKFMANSIENRLVRRREVKEYNEVLTILTQTRREIENDSFMMVAWNFSAPPDQERFTN